MFFHLCQFGDELWQSWGIKEKSDGVEEYLSEWFRRQVKLAKKTDTKFN